MTKSKKSCTLKTMKVSDLIEGERLDAKKIIREGIQSLPEDEVAYDDTFRRDLTISKDRWKEHSTDPEFDDFKARLPNKKLVWGKAKTIEELKKWDGVV